MFGVDFSELMVIFVVALIVIGPERLPKVARTAGHYWGRAQRLMNSVKADIDGVKAELVQGMSASEIQQMQQKINQEVLRTEQEANKITMAINQQVQQVHSTVDAEAKVISQQVQQAEQKKLPLE